MTEADRAYSANGLCCPIETSNKINGAPLTAAPVTQASRRGVLAALTGGALLAAGGAAEAASPDAGLIALGDRYFEALARSEAAYDRLEECDMAYDVAKPAMPDILRHRIDDHFSFDFPIGPTTRCITNGEGSAFFAADEIRELREIPRMRGPKGRRIPCPEGQARADTVVAAWDAHHSACQALPEWTALEAAGGAYDEAVADRRKIEREICEARATTLDGLRIRARVLLRMFDDDLEGLDDGRDLSRSLMWSTMRDLSAI